MNDRKQYATKVVMNIIHFMATMSTGICSMEEAEKMFNDIPEELQSEVMAALIAARKVHKKAVMSKLASVFPIEEILRKAMKEDL